LRRSLRLCDRSLVNLRRARALFAMATLLAACGSEAHDAEGLPAEPIAEVVPERVIREAPPPIYDEEGNLLASEERVAGLVLPVSLEPMIEEERRHVYRTRVPLTKVLSFFGPRLVTGRVDRSAGGGATYRDALPQGASGAYVHVDVAITPIPGPATRVEIVELLPPPTTPPTEQEAMDELARRMREAE
jgi:hypothetical protein